MVIREKLLVVEDECLFQDLFDKQISGVVKIISAKSHQEARVRVGEHADIALIVLDGLVPNYTEQAARANDR